MLTTLCALPLVLGLNLGTYHFDRNQGFKEFNPGVYALCLNSWVAGGYSNSIGGFSLHGGLARQWLGLDWEIGAVSGYRRAPILPLIAPSYKFTNGARLTLLLPAEKHGGALHLSWEF